MSAPDTDRAAKIAAHLDALNTVRRLVAARDPFTIDGRTGRDAVAHLERVVAELVALVDAIGDLPADAQKRLIRAWRERCNV